jgi:hypothetical protein
LGRPAATRVGCLTTAQTESAGVEKLADLVIFRSMVVLCSRRLRAQLERAGGVSVHRLDPVNRRGRGSAGAPNDV